MFQLYTDIQGYMCTQAKTLCSGWSKTTGVITNKHSVGIAEAIHVPYRPQQISKRHNSCKNT